MVDFSADFPYEINNIFECFPQGLLLVDEGSQILDLNPPALIILGKGRKELRGSNFIDLIEIEFRKDFMNILECVKDGVEISRKTEIRITHPEISNFWVEFSLTRLKSGFFLMIIHEIQEKKEIEQEVEELHRCLNDRIEMERVQLAQELHDGAIQDLHSIQYQLSALEKQFQKGLQEEIELVMETVSKVRSELRRISYDLRPPTLSRFGLAKSIRRDAEEFEGKHPEFNFQFNLIEDDNLLPEEIRLALFRVYQQAVGNILQHSGASEIKINLFLEDRDVLFRIEDNGSGFSLPERWISLVRKGHYGLVGSKERINNLGGKFEVDSEPGEGTIITVRIPDVMRKGK